MAKFRQIQTSFWSNTYIQEEMTSEDKYFYLYLMTNECTTQIGIYPITKKQMAFDLGYSMESVKALLQRFETYHKLIKYDSETRELILLKWAESNLNIGGKPVQDLIKKEIEQVKNKEFLSLMYSNCPDNSLKKFIGLLIYKNNDSYNDSVNESSNDPIANLFNYNQNNEKNIKVNNSNTSYESSDASFNDTGAINNKEEIINNNHDNNILNNIKNIKGDDDLKIMKQWFKENKIDFSKKHEAKIIELLKINSLRYLLKLFQEQMDILKNKPGVKNIAAIFSEHLFKGTVEINLKEIKSKEIEQENLKNEEKKESENNEKYLEIFKGLSLEQQKKIELDILEKHKIKHFSELKNKSEFMYYRLISSFIFQELKEKGLI